MVHKIRFGNNGWNKKIESGYDSQWVYEWSTKISLEGYCTISIVKEDAYLYQYCLRTMWRHGNRSRFDTLETAEPWSKILKFQNLSRMIMHYTKMNVFAVFNPNLIFYWMFLILIWHCSVVILITNCTKVFSCLVTRK